MSFENRATGLKALQAPMGFHVGGLDRRIEALVKGKTVLNVGAKNMGEEGWINMDIVPHGPAVNLLGDAGRLPLADGAVDAVVMKFVLEHVPDPAAVVGEIHRALKPGGHFYATVPFVEPFHADPGDYQRFTVDGLRRLCGAFEVLECGFYYGPASALVEFMREFCAAFFDTPVLKKGVRFLAGWLFLPFKYLDFYLARKMHAHQCAYGLYVLARKRR